MKVALRIRWPRSRVARSPHSWAPLALLWALALWPTRPEGAVWAELVLGALALLRGHEVFRRGLGACALRLDLTPDLFPTVAAGVGFAFSFLSLALHASGRLPASFVDPRGGPLLLFAEAATMLFARLLMPSIAYGPARATPDHRPQQSGWPSIPGWVRASVASATLLAVGTGAVLGELLALLLEKLEVTLAPARLAEEADIAE